MKRFIIKLVTFKDGTSSLMLCSTKIKEGDRAFHPMVNNGRPILITTEIEADVISDGGFSIIGKVSEDANWVKEDDEFNEDEVQYDYAINAYYIKCSKCKSFH